MINTGARHNYFNNVLKREENIPFHENAYRILTYMPHEKHCGLRQSLNKRCFLNKSVKTVKFCNIPATAMLDLFTYTGKVDRIVMLDSPSTVMSKYLRNNPAVIIAL
jgi:hypothetical protein